MKSSFRLFKIAGIGIGIPYSWLLIFPFFTYTLAQLYFPSVFPGWSIATYWIAGAISALAIFVSVLLHELAHSLVARANGIPVHSITLFILGGVSNLEEEPQKPWSEFAMAIVGPVTSLVLGFILWGIGRGLGVSSTSNAALAVIYYLGVINIYLGIFNLLPGFPLDGGRVLRSIIWGSTGNLIRATNIAGFVGQLFGWVLIGIGVYFVVIGNIFNGLWFAFIGWFLMSAADASRKDVRLKERLSGVKVRQLMNMNVPTIAPETSVQDMVAGIFRRQQDRAVPVCQGGQLAGIATITDVKKVPQEKWAATPVGEIMTRGNLYTVSPDDNLQMAMELIAKHDINQVLIKDGGKCAGLLTRADIIRYIQMSQELGISNRAGDSKGK